MELRLFIDPESDQPHMFDMESRRRKCDRCCQGRAKTPPTRKAKKKSQGKKRNGRKASRQKFPAGWDETRVRKVIAHYKKQTEDVAVAEDEAAYRNRKQTVMIVPTELVPAIRQLIARVPNA